MKYSKLIVLFIIVMNALFAGAVLWVFLKTSAEPTILVGAWFAWTTGELWALAMIKKKESEVEKNERSENSSSESAEG